MPDPGVVLIRPRAPFVTWAATVRPNTDEMTTADLTERDRTAAYLVPRRRQPEPGEDLLSDVWAELFCCELVTWTEDEDDWPMDRDIEMFRAWFEIEVHWCSVDLRPPGHEEAWFHEEELNGETL